MADDDECPHGLDPSWCTFCRKKAAGEPPTGVRRPPVRAASPTRAARAKAAPAAKAATANPRRGPAEALATTRKVVFHAAPYRAWPSIAELGLLTPKQLLGDDPRLGDVRAQAIELPPLDSGQAIAIRDQRAMARANIEAHLDGISLPEWLDVLNERAFFFAKQKELTSFLGRYQESEGLDVLAFDTARLVAEARGRIEVSTLAPTAPVPWDRCPCRSRSTFEPLGSFRGDVADIQEITVIDGLAQVAGLVVRVIRYHPDRTTEVLVA